MPGTLCGIDILYWQLLEALGGKKKELFLANQPVYFQPMLPWNLMPHYAKLCTFIHTSMDIVTKLSLPDLFSSTLIHIS